jgi:hypothetical protein
MRQTRNGRECMGAMPRHDGPSLRWLHAGLSCPASLLSCAAHIFFLTSTCASLRSYSLRILAFSCSTSCSFSRLNSCEHTAHGEGLSRPSAGAMGHALRSSAMLLGPAPPRLTL